MRRIYLDNCCLNRAFDDQSQDRVKLETEAIAVVMRRITGHEWQWIGSSVLEIDEMSAKELPLLEVHRRGLRALAKALGPADYVRFLKLYRSGKGDYTKERAKWLDGDSMDEIAEKIRAKQKKKRVSYHLNRISSPLRSSCL
jgi:hypothetical protein